jgi:hypothetical protein
VECEDAVVTRQQQGKHMSAAKDMHTTIPELLKTMFFYGVCDEAI